MKDWTLAWIGAGALGVSAWTCDPALLADDELASRFARALEESCRRSGVPLLAVAVLPGSVHALLGRGGRVLPTIPFGLAKAAVTRTSGCPRAWRSRVRVLPIAAARIPHLVERLATASARAACRRRQTRVSEA